MKRLISYIALLAGVICVEGCTQVVTAPVSIATTAVGVTYDITSAAVGAALPDGGKESD